MVQNARQRTKVYLDSYWTPANTLKDDSVSQLGTEIMYAWPPYGLDLELKAPSVVDVVLALEQSTSHPILDFDGAAIGYNESIPIKIRSMDKTGVTATLAIEQAENEVRRILEVYPSGSIRMLERTRPATRMLGQEWLWGADYVMTYERDTT